MTKSRFFDDLRGMYSDRISEALTAIMNNERFMMTFQKMMLASLEFRDIIQKSVTAALEQVNIPTKGDVAKLQEELHALEDRLFSVEEIMERMETKLDALQVPKTTAKKRASSAKGAKSKEISA